ncbi:hypothetical protein GTH32_04370 [Alteromonas sp. 345S023]|uniref:DUF4231 domain-containing protein n=1 Tax=Alteromonas profundi TaxID=2696062 RepID=A0A7X5LJB8_9ALTE|nr:DUF4231 domain-containing protein [Alteromonas profundi]NDV90431.1 hypothetical protein [Alteromonas profundi]
MTNKVALLIGVTGHRDAVLPCANAKKDTAEKAPTEGKESTRLLLDALKGALQGWRKLVGKETPIWLLTGMAAGPDLLAIQAVESLMESEDDWNTDNTDVIPVMPMPRTHFIKDFADGDEHSRVSFEYYYNKYQENVIDVIPAMSKEDLAFAYQDTQYGRLRNQLYLNQGAFLSRYSNVLIALWDGKDSNSVGGTADVVKMKLGLSRPDYNAVHPSLQMVSRFDGQNGGLVQQIPVKRKSSGKGEDITRTLRTIDQAPFSNMASLYVCRDCEQSQHSVLTHSLTKEMTTLIEQLNAFNLATPPASTDHSEDHSFASGLGKISGVFLQADNEALRIQKTYRRLLILFMLFAIVAFTAYELVATVLNTLTGVGVLTLLLSSVAATFMLIKWSRKAQHKRLYQLNRMVAESLRLRCYLNLAGVPPSVKPMMPRRYRPLFPIVSQAVKLGELVLWQNKVTLNIARAKDEWISEQIKYLNNKLGTDAGNIQKGLAWLHAHPKLALATFNKWSLAFFVVAFAIGLATLATQTWLLWPHISDINGGLINPEMAKHWLLNGCEATNNASATPSNFALVWWCNTDMYVMFIIQLLVMFGGVIALWVELANYRASTAGFEGMKFLYEKAQALLNEPISKEELQSLLNELAREAMQEHVEWNLSEEESDIARR